MAFVLQAGIRRLGHFVSISPVAQCLDNGLVPAMAPGVVERSKHTGQTTLGLFRERLYGLCYRIVVALLFCQTESGKDENR